MPASAYVVAASVALEDGADPASVGAAVTVELCGHWDHPGPCRWPHNNEIEAARDAASFAPCSSWTTQSSPPSGPASKTPCEAGPAGACCL